MDFDELDYEEMSEEEYINREIMKVEAQLESEKEQSWFGGEDNENLEETK